MRKIDNEDISDYNFSIKTLSPEERLKEKYPFYICRNSYRKLKDSEDNWIKSVEIVFSEIVTYLMDNGYKDSWIFLFMAGSSIGREYANGDYTWQRLSEEAQMKIIDFNRYLYKQKIEAQDKEMWKNVPDYMKDKNEKENPEDKLPADHPLRDPYVLVNVDKELDLRIVHEKRNRLVIFICAISAFLCEKPLGAGGLGPSSVGKNMVFDTVLRHIPEKYPDEINETKAGWFLSNNIKEAALFRLDPEFLNHTIVYLGETPDKPTETHLELMGYLRQLQSEGRIAKTLSEQITELSGVKNWRPKTYKLEAEVSFFALSIHGFEEQYGNRHIPLSFDESEEQTNRIGNWKAEIEKYGTKRYDVSVRSTTSKYIEKVIAGIDKIWYEHYKTYAFDNPYSEHVNYILKKLYSGSIQYRRVITYVFRFIEVITRLHTFNRTIEHTDYGSQIYRIVATSEDNLIALYLLWPSLQQAIQQITREDTGILDKIREVFEQEIPVKLVKNAEWERGEWFSANAMGTVLNKNRNQIRETCKRLYKAGYLNSKAGNKKGSWYKYSISENPVASDPIGPSSILPFFLSADIPVCLLSMWSENSYSMIGLYFPQLFALFDHNKMTVGTHYIRVQYIYKYIVQGSIDKFESELKKIKEEDLENESLNSPSSELNEITSKDDSKINIENKDEYHTLKFKTTSKRSKEGMAKLLTQYKIDDGPIGSLAKGSYGIKFTLKERIVNKLIMIAQNDPNNSEISLIEIRNFVNKKRKKQITNEELKDIMEDIMNDYSVYEPVPDIFKYIV